jgi:hypothetical protein
MRTPLFPETDGTLRPGWAGLLLALSLLSTGCASLTPPPGGGLKTNQWGIAGKANGIFVRYLDYGERQLRWIDAELAAATRLANAASQVGDPDMQLALLRLAGPRLEAAMSGFRPAR